MSHHLNPATALSDHPASLAVLTSNGAPVASADARAVALPAEARRLPPSLKHTQAQRTASGTPLARDGL